MSVCLSTCLSVCMYSKRLVKKYKATLKPYSTIYIKIYFTTERKDILYCIFYKKNMLHDKTIKEVKKKFQIGFTYKI